MKMAAKSTNETIKRKKKQQLENRDTNIGKKEMDEATQTRQTYAAKLETHYSRKRTHENAAQEGQFLETRYDNQDTE